MPNKRYSANADKWHSTKTRIGGFYSYTKERDPIWTNLSLTRYRHQAGMKSRTNVITPSIT